MPSPLQLAQMPDKLLLAVARNVKSYEASRSAPLSRLRSNPLRGLSEDLSELVLELAARLEEAVAGRVDRLQQEKQAISEYVRGEMSK